MLCVHRKSVYVPNVAGAKVERRERATDLKAGKAWELRAGVAEPEERPYEMKTRSRPTDRDYAAAVFQRHASEV